jgi:hypothetical protein
MSINITGIIGVKNINMTVAGAPPPNASVQFTPNGYLSTNSNSVLSLGTGDFTVEAWMYKTGAPGGSGIPSDTFLICNSTTNLNTAGAPFWFFGVFDGLLYCNIHGPAGAPGGGGMGAAFTPTNDVWYHVAAVRQSGAGAIYVNGISQTLTYNPGIDGRTFGQDGLLIGAATTPAFSRGNISNFRMTKSAVYTGNFTPSTRNLEPLPQTVVLTCRGDTPEQFTDYSVNNLTFTATGSATVSSLNPFVA